VAIEITPSSNYPGGEFTVTGGNEPGFDYYLYNPGGGCGTVTVPSTIDTETDFGASCSFDYILAEFGSEAAYGTWYLCEYEGGSPEPTCEGSTSYDTFTWEQAPAPEFSSDLVAVTPAGLLSASLLPQMFVITMVVSLLLSLFTKSLRQELH
jgi:hypothetical protein